jgi:hypothetical protein
MRTIPCVLAAAIASLTIAFAPAATASPSRDAVPTAGEDEAVTLTGVVKEKSEKEFTLKEPGEPEKETRIELTDETKYVKDGKPATAADLSAGARVSVKAKQGFLGRHEALEVTILPSQTGPEPGPSPTGH